MRAPVAMTVAACLMMGAAQAAPITFYFAGTIDDVSNNQTVPFNGVNEFPGVQVGDSFSGHYTFESTTLGNAAGSTTTYDFADTSSFYMFAQFGTESLETDGSVDMISQFGTVPGISSRITVSNDVPVSTPFDAYRVRTATTLPSGNASGAPGPAPDFDPLSTIEMQIDLFTTANLAAITSQDLPLTPPSLADFTGMRWAVLGGFPNVFVEGTIEQFSLLPTTAVSEPGTLTLVALGLVCFMWMGVFSGGRAVRISENGRGR